MKKQIIPLIETVKISEEQLRRWRPCKDGLDFVALHGFDWLRAWNACERGDWMLWLLRKAGALDKRTSVHMAIAFAEHVLPRFESRYPREDRPRKAIEAAKACLENPCEETRKAADAAAAYATSAVDDAAYAAYAAAYAAYAADDAAADDADAAAADDADAAAADAAAYTAATAADAAAAAAADAAAYTSATAADDAAADAYTAATSAASAAAADDADGRKKERKWQAETIRKIVGKCPFES